ncbi:MAG: hypothetical protein ACUVWR_12405 [Anaerolineae bacterium]
MTTFRAGFGCADITPRLGCRLTGYSNRPGSATGVHDPLLARALVLERERDRYALIACELLYTPEAFDEGGYEPISPTLHGISRYYQQRVWEAVRAAL